MSATADRSARAIQRSLFMAAMVIRGFSWASRERGREKSRELREKPLPAILVTLELQDTLEARNRCALPSSRPSLGLRIWWCRKVPSVRSI